MQRSGIRGGALVHARASCGSGAPIHVCIPDSAALHAGLRFIGSRTAELLFCNSRYLVRQVLMQDCKERLLK